jgi:uncharacterized protein (DUF1330 family)
MAAYAIFIREEGVVDEEAMAEYRNRNRSNAPAVPVKPLVVYGAMEAMEGDAPDGIVVLEFANLDDARAWYNDPAYQEATILRRKGAPSYRCVLVEGWTPPA